MVLLWLQSVKHKKRTLYMEKFIHRANIYYWQTIWLRVAKSWQCKYINIVTVWASHIHVQFYFPYDYNFLNDNFTTVVYITEGLIVTNQCLIQPLLNLGTLKILVRQCCHFETVLKWSFTNNNHVTRITVTHTWQSKASTISYH